MCKELSPAEDPSHPHNSDAYLTGSPCVCCGNPAGTAWSPFWCQSCNAQRLRRIGASFAAIAKATAHQQANRRGD